MTTTSSRWGSLGVVEWGGLGCWSLLRRFSMSLTRVLTTFVTRTAAVPMVQTQRMVTPGLFPPNIFLALSSLISLQKREFQGSWSSTTTTTTGRRKGFTRIYYCKEGPIMVTYWVGDFGGLYTHVPTKIWTHPLNMVQICVYICEKDTTY